MPVIDGSAHPSKVWFHEPLLIQKWDLVKEIVNMNINSFYIFAASTLLAATMLSSCGGESVADHQANSSEEGDTTNVSYLPRTVFESSSEFSEAYVGEQDGVFLIDIQPAFISRIIINPINAQSFAPVSNASVNDFSQTIDGVEIDPLESFPNLQKVVGVDIVLRTALLFDVSGSTDGIDIQALVDEAKAYIQAVKSSDNPVIRNQEFVIWAFGQSVESLLSPFSSDLNQLNNALDQVVVRFNNGVLGSSSNIHRAVVEAIGRYKDDDYDFRDWEFGQPYVLENDLVDTISPDLVELSQLVVFSSGPDTGLEMSLEQMTDAIQSQGLVNTDALGAAPPQNAGDSGDDTGDENPGEAAGFDGFFAKPVFNYVVGGTSAGVVYDNLRDLAENTRLLPLSNGAYSFSNQLINDQRAAISRRLDLDTLYMFSYAFLPRRGAHEIVFSSRTESFNYYLFSETVEEFISTIGVPEQELSSLVELTGANGEYISARTVNLSEMATFSAYTRWVNDPYDLATNYSWSAAGCSGTVNVSGTFTVNTISGASCNLTVTNTVRGESDTIVVFDQ